MQCNDASWFNVNAISDHERCALPEWLNGRGGTGATASSYRATRNAMVELCKHAPGVCVCAWAHGRKVSSYCVACHAMRVRAHS